MLREGGGGWGKLRTAGVTVSRSPRVDISPHRDPVPIWYVGHAKLGGLREQRRNERIGFAEEPSIQRLDINLPAKHTAYAPVLFIRESSTLPVFLSIRATHDRPPNRTVEVGLRSRLAQLACTHDPAPSTARRVEQRDPRCQWRQ